MKDERPFWVRVKGFVRRENPPCPECERLKIPRHYDRFRTSIVEIVSCDLPKPWEHFSDQTILDVIATMKMGCDTHQDEYYNHVGERTGPFKQQKPNIPICVNAANEPRSE